MADISMEMMDEEQLSKIDSFKIRVLGIGILVVFAIIVLILFNIVSKKMEIKDIESQYANVASSNLDFKVCDDIYLYKFVTDYFKARTNLNFPKIFSSFGREYFKEKRNDKNGLVKKIESDIRYEKTFIRSYDDIKIYTCDGYKENEIVCIASYNLVLGFSDGTLPMMSILYIVKNDTSFTIVDNLDVGTSKYLMSVMNSEFVKALYNDVKMNLQRAITANESSKLTYNSIRQHTMNIVGGVNYEDYKLLDKLNVKSKSIILDQNEIYAYIVNEKKKDEAKAKLDALLAEFVKNYNK